MNGRLVLLSCCALVLVLVSTLGLVAQAQEITALIVKAPASRDVQVQLVPTDKGTISAEANGRTVPVEIDDSTATATVNVQMQDNNNNKGGKNKGGKDNKSGKHKKGGGHHNDDSGDDSAGFSLMRSSPSSLLVLFFVVAVVTGFVGVSSSSAAVQQRRGTSTTTMIMTLATIACVLIALMTTSSDGEVNETVSATGFIPTYLVLLSHEYFVFYNIPRGTQIVFYFFRGSRGLALVAATSPERLSNVASGLSSVGFAVTSFDATTATPSVTQLRTFEYVLVFSDPTHAFFDKTALGDNLARAFDSGIKVVTATFANAAEQPLGGKFADVSNGYILLDPSASTTSPSASLGSALSQDVYLVTGVKTFSAQAAYGTSGSIVNGGRAGLSWSDGRPLVVVGEVNDRRRTDLNFFPVSNSTTDQGLWVGDGWTLLRNAIAYNS